MRKLVVIVVLMMGCFALVTGTASAQKDPFHPVIDPNADTGTAGTTTSSGSTTSGAFTPPSIGSEGLANTGADVEPWLAVAYGLIVVGGGALTVVRLQSPRQATR